MPASAPALAFLPHHVMGVDDLSTAAVELLFERTRFFVERFREPQKKMPLLEGRTVLTLFFEPSTRTHTSFEIAAKRLSADVVDIAAGNTSVSKGESLGDTAIALNAMRPDALILRHKSTDAPSIMAPHMGCPIINAGNGVGEHPSQALLDAYTIQQKKGTLEGLTVAICGDSRHSRVAHSNMKLLTRLGAHVNLIGPASLMPQKVESNRITLFNSLERGLEHADIVMTLRVQRERMATPFELSVDDYFKAYGLDEEKLKHAKPDALVMDPGPVIRGVHIADSVVDGRRCLVREQVENGVAMRAALLEYLLTEPAA